MALEQKTEDDARIPVTPDTEEDVRHADAVRQEIQLRAYYRYCERGCGPDCESEDWLAAEREVLALHAAPGASVAEAPVDDRAGRRQGRARR